MLSKNVVRRLKGELLLARAQRPQALEILKNWKETEQEKALLHDSLAYAYFRLGRSDDAFLEIQELRKNLGQVWHQPESYFPGTDADLLFLAATEALRLKRPEARELLVEYCKRREAADPDLPDVQEAVALLRALGR